ncbi:MAG: NAD(P)-dependent oxidoreductase [Gammaproteobacteria bacterium]|nr:NAD(P)-dependent oxidoreductase [Gammaproteobacteria bacterium]
MRRAVVFGGAGFIGSTLCEALAKHGWAVRAVDGLLPRTAGDAANLIGVRGVELLRRVVEPGDALVDLVAGVDLVVDAMGWTRHLEAMQDPLYDLRLNLSCHLPLLRACAEGQPRAVIYLASRHQYGRVEATVITEDTPQVPVDVQGIHKCAAEQHWRLTALATGVAVVSLRFGNTFGPSQPVGTGDVGLVGGFLDAALGGRAIVVYDGARRRDLLFAPDLATVVTRVAEANLSGFTPLNVSGTDVTVVELAEAVVAACGSGSVALEPLPEHVQRVEVGAARLDASRLVALIGPVEPTPLADALRRTVTDVRRRLLR